MRFYCYAIACCLFAAGLTPSANAQLMTLSTPGQTVGGGFFEQSGFRFAQGSRQVLSSTTPSLTTMNGYPGSISSGTIRPFVTGITPVIGGYAYGNPAADNASANLFRDHQQSQAMQLQHRTLAHQQSKQGKAMESFERAVRAEAAGDLRAARANFKRALSLDQGPLRADILLRMNSRGWK